MEQINVIATAINRALTNPLNDLSRIFLMANPSLMMFEISLADKKSKLPLSPRGPGSVGKHEAEIFQIDSFNLSKFPGPA
jgi:hypothetical protein